MACFLYEGFTLWRHPVPADSNDTWMIWGMHQTEHFIIILSPNTRVIFSNIWWQTASSGTAVVFSSGSKHRFVLHPKLSDQIPLFASRVWCCANITLQQLFWNHEFYLLMFDVWLKHITLIYILHAGSYSNFLSGCKTTLWRDYGRS